MGIFEWLGGLFSDDNISSRGIDDDHHSCTPGVNPATGLPMIDCGNAIDVAGNPYGVDLHDSHGSSAFSDDTWSSSASFSLND